MAPLGGVDVDQESAYIKPILPIYHQIPLEFWSCLISNKVFLYFSPTPYPPVVYFWLCFYPVKYYCNQKVPAHRVGEALRVVVGHYFSVMNSTYRYHSNFGLDTWDLNLLYLVGTFN